jgi:glycosyltransferase involved in cell wall biosynthesis
MRVCMLVRNPCTYDRRVMREAKALTAEGHQVTVLAHHQEGLPDAERRDGYTIRRIPVRHLLAVWRYEVRNHVGRVYRTALHAQRVLGAVTRRLVRRSLRASGPLFWPLLVLWAALRPLSWALLKGTEVAGLLGYAVLDSRWLADWIRRLRRNQWIFTLSYRRELSATAERLAADVYHAHDLNTLSLAVRVAHRVGAAVVYDSHELQTGREALRWSRFDWWYWAREERRLIHVARRVLTVSDSIADALAARYRIRRPLVVTNAEAGLADPPAAGRHDWRQDLGLGPDQRLVMYVGGFQPNRGLEVAIDAMRRLNRRHVLVLIGPAVVGGYARQLRGRIKAAGLGDRVFIRPAVPPGQVVPSLAQADVSLLLTQNSCLNHYLSLPNKLFSSIRAAAPLVASDLAEIRRVVGSGPFGVVCRESDPAAVAEAIRQVAADPDRYRPGAGAIAAVEARWGWTASRRRLVRAYERIALRRGRRTARSRRARVPCHREIA